MAGPPEARPENGQGQSRKGRGVARGFLSGFMWGSVAAAAGAVGLAIQAGPPRPLAEEVADLSVPSGSGFGRGVEGAQTAREAVPQADAPRADAPRADDLAPLDEADRAAALRPEAGAAPDGIASPPGEGRPAPALESAADAPLDAPTASVPSIPETESQAAVPGDTPAPQAGPALAPGALAAPATPPDDGPVAPAADLSAPATPSAAEAPARATPEDDPAADTSAARPDAGADDLALDTPGVPETAPGVQAGTETPVLPSPGTPAPPPPGGEDSPSMATAPLQPPAPEGTAQESPFEDAAEEDTAGQRFGRPAGSLDDLAPQVATNRLPTVTDQQEDTATTTEDQPPAIDTDAPPLVRYATPFEPSGDRPLMAVILLDEGPGGLGPEAIQSLGFPVSVAVDAQSADAPDMMRAYRAQGREVLAMGALPAGAQPQDAEIALAAWFAAVPEAVALMEASEGALQPGRDLSEQVSAFLADSGHGLVLFPQGLNTGEALAVRAGVPAATVFRDFDGAGQDARAIRRFLDNAAFRARQEGAVIMVGRLRAETLSALTFWALQDRAESVALAPVSALLQARR